MASIKAALAAVALLALAAHAAPVGRAFRCVEMRRAARDIPPCPGPRALVPDDPATRAPQAPKHADEWVLVRHPSQRERADNVPAAVRAKLVAKGLGSDLKASMGPA